MAASHYLQSALRQFDSQMRARNGITVETLADTYTFDAASPNFGAFDPNGSNRNMQLPAVGDAAWFFGIYTNSGSVAANLVFLDSAAATVATVPNGACVVLACDGVAWMAAVSTSLAGALAIANTWQLTQTFTLPIVLPVGAVGAPSWGFTGDLDNGPYRIGANNWGHSVGGVIAIEYAATYEKLYASGALVLTVGASSVVSAQPVLGPVGAVAAVALGTSGDVNTGLYFPAADVLGLVAGGVEYTRIKYDATFPTLLDYSAPRVAFRARAAMADADATISDAQFRGGIISMTPTATRSLTTRTAAQMLAAFPGAQIGTSHVLEVVNLAAAQVIAIIGGTGVTVVGVANTGGTTLNLSGAGRYRLVFTNVTPSAEACDLVRVG